MKATDKNLSRARAKVKPAVAPENLLIKEIYSWCYFKFISEPEGKKFGNLRIPSNWNVDFWFRGFWRVAVKFDDFTWAMSEISCNGISIVEALTRLLEKLKKCKIIFEKDSIRINYSDGYSLLTRENWSKKDDPKPVFKFPDKQ